MPLFVDLIAMGNPGLGLPGRSRHGGRNTQSIHFVMRKLAVHKRGADLQGQSSVFFREIFGTKSRVDRAFPF